MPNGVKVSEFDYRANDDGDLHVTATVRNERDEATTVTLIASVKAGDGESQQELDRSERFDVDGGESADASFTFDVPYARFERDGSLDLELHEDQR
jgi:hypothetical protein